MTTRRTARVEVRLTEEERQRVLARAHDAGWPGRGLAEFLRRSLLGLSTDVERPPANVRLMSMAAAAETLGVERQQVYVLAAEGKLKAFELPEGRRVKESDVLALKASKKRRKRG